MNIFLFLCKFNFFESRFQKLYLGFSKNTAINITPPKLQAMLGNGEKMLEGDIGVRKVDHLKVFANFQFFCHFFEPFCVFRACYPKVFEC